MVEPCAKTAQVKEWEAKARLWEKIKKQFTPYLLFDEKAGKATLRAYQIILTLEAEEGESLEQVLERFA